MPRHPLLDGEELYGHENRGLNCESICKRDNDTLFDRNASWSLIYVFSYYLNCCRKNEGTVGSDIKEHFRLSFDEVSADAVQDVV